LTQWHGTDFNPSQAGFAQELAAASGSDAKLYDEAFAEFSQRADLPEFDYIGLHGIWSWISEENRHVIVDFVRRKLKVGGVLYISYNTQPGWAAFAPMRHLMTEHAEVLGSEGGGIVSRIDGAMDFAEKLLATNPLFSLANPHVGERLKKMKEHSRHYLAHEYFNRDWHPMHFATMAEWLEPAKVQFACSANPLDLIDVVNLTPDQQTFLAEIPDPMFRQTTRDFMVNQQFRKDYWVKGARKMSALEQAEALRQIRVILTTPRADIPLKVTGALGEASLSEGIYNPILELLADYKSRTLGEVDALLKDKVNFAQLTQAVTLLSGAGHLTTVQDDSAKSSKTAKAINTHLMLKARGSNELTYLASPVTGGGVAVNRFHQLFLLSQQQGKKQPEDWAKDTWAILAVQNQRLLKDGVTLASAEDNLAELTLQAKEFADKQLPLLQALQIA
jgi:SAM-dependent methyltransferase